MKTMRELAIEAMAKRNAGSSPQEVRNLVWRGANALALEKGSKVLETGDDKSWEMRLESTGEIVAYSNGGYSYRPR